MRTSVAIVADDLTGAADSGIGFRRAGLATSVVWILDRPAEWPLADIDVIAIDGETRALPRQAAVERSLQIVSRLRTSGVAHLYRKIDSTFRGHVGAEVGATLRAWHPWSLAIVAPAFPAMGRITRGGEQRVDGAFLRIGPIAQLLDQAGVRADHADVGRVRGGTLHLMMADACSRGVRAIVCDAETDDDLLAVAAAGATLGERALWVGSGGLAQVLPRALALERPSRVGQEAAVAGRAVLTVVGSRTGVAREQLRALAAAGALHVNVSPQVLADAKQERASLLCDEVAAPLDAGQDVVISIASGDGTSREDSRLPRVLGELLAPIAPRVGGLVLTGGDTARGVLDAWGISSLALSEEVEPGLPLSFSRGALRLPVVTKAGGFGGPQALANARDRIREVLGLPESASSEDAAR